MKNHNYYDTFIETAEDCAASQGTVPQPYRGKGTIAMTHYRLLAQPYARTQQEVLWLTETQRTGQDPADDAAQEAFFAPGRACLRASPLTKQYGWGIHFDSQGRAALVGAETAEYQRFKADPQLKHIRGMRSKK